MRKPSGDLCKRRLRRIMTSRRRAILAGGAHTHQREETANGSRESELRLLRGGSVAGRARDAGRRNRPGRRGRRGQADPGGHRRDGRPYHPRGLRRRPTHRRPARGRPLPRPRPGYRCRQRCGGTQAHSLHGPVRRRVGRPVRRRAAAVRGKPCEPDRCGGPRSRRAGNGRGDARALPARRGVHPAQRPADFARRRGRRRPRRRLDKDGQALARRHRRVDALSARPGRQPRGTGHGRGPAQALSVDLRTRATRVSRRW